MYNSSLCTETKFQESIKGNLNKKNLIENPDKNDKIKYSISNEKICNNELNTPIIKDIVPLKTFPSNGNLNKIQHQIKPNKTVSFVPTEDLIQKFTAGEVIIDQKNPFKRNSQNIETNNERKNVRLRKNINKQKSLNNSDFVTKAQVLDESKYVKTYIKNPDKYFVYDPAIIARLKLEELLEFRNKKQPNKLKLSIETQERLKDLKNKTSSSQNRLSNSKIPTYKRASKSNYPDLTQIKVKIGTDLEESLFNSQEVALNAKKFDDRVKKLNISSEDDLDDIEESLTKSDSSDEITQVEETKISQTNNEIKSFTNTVNSNEFREYLDKKGLTLAPKELKTNGNLPLKNKTSFIIEQQLNMELKKTKKPSVFQRLLPSGIFSSKRKTTPKESVPMPQNLYNKTNDDIKTSKNIKRVILERQSFHGNSTNSNESTNDLRKQSERSRKSFGGDDRSSSISSALTNAEELSTINPNDSIIEIKKDQQPNKQVSIVETISKPSRYNFSNSSLTKDHIENTKNINCSKIKPQRISGSLQKRVNQTEKNLIEYKKPLQRQTQNFRRNAYENKSWSDCSETSKKSNISLTKNKIRNSITPKNSREDLFNDGPKMTSTPVQIIEEVRHQQLNELESLSPIKDAKVKSEPQNDPVLNVYEKLPSLHDKLIQRKVSSNFLRGTQQRNTISSFQRNRTAKVIDGATVDFPDSQIIPIERPMLRSLNTCQPPRSQSVLDEMLMPEHTKYGELGINIGGTPVILRRKNIPTLTRDEILTRVKDFCRRSMNKASATLGSNSVLHEDINRKISSDVSPISYASVDGQKDTLPKIMAPQVPQRTQSLQNGIPHSPQRQNVHLVSSSPIYAHVVKRCSVQSNVSDIYDTAGANSPDATTIPSQNYRNLNSSDSVFLPDGQKALTKNSPRHFVVIDNGKVTSDQITRFRDRTGSEENGRIYPSAYGYIQVKPQNYQNRGQKNDRNIPIITNTRMSPVYMKSSQAIRYYNDQQKNHTENIVFLPVKDDIHKNINSNRNFHQNHFTRAAYPLPYESESGSEAGEVQRIFQTRKAEEDWQNDKTGRNQSSDQGTDDRRRAPRREDPRRHTLGGDMVNYTSGQGQPQQRSVDLEMGTRAQKIKKQAPPIRGYTPINQGPLFDDDPGIMSEVETASTGFRRGGKQRSSLPVVRTPSKTLERPLGLVFLQYRSETKRALLPNEITSIDTVRALFVRSFPRQLTMAYLEGPNVKIYIHDASKDMFYELEDVRSHLREIRDRSVLRLFESNEVAAPQVLPGGPGVPQPLPLSGGHWDQDQSYFSEPEFDSEYQHQHIHKSKVVKPAPYYVGATQTLPRGMFSDRGKKNVGTPAKPLRSYCSRGSMGPTFPYSPDQLYSIPDGYTSSPERGTRSAYEEPYYSQYGTRGSTVTPIIDEEQRCLESLTEDQYTLYGLKVAGRIPRTPGQLYDPTRPEDLHRIRVEHMERQLANLTGLVQKALIHNPQIVAPVGQINSNYLGVPGQCRTGLDDMDGHSSGSSTSIQDKSVSFEKSVSFSDDIQGAPKSYSPQHAGDTKPPKPAIKSSTLPRTSSQERDRLKPPPPPKPLALASTHPNYRADIALAPEAYNHLRGLQKKAKDLRMEVRTLRRLSQAQAVAVREDIKDAFMRIRATLLASSGTYWGQGDQEKTRISREEELYKQEVIRLEKDLSDLESSVEGLRGEVINRRTRVNMAAVEDMALVLSRASKTVAELKMRFPGLQQGLRHILSNEMEKVVREEKFLKDEPDRLESALRRCKKLTGTLVTLKRLASVQEQRLPPNEPTTIDDIPRSAEISSANKPIPSPRLGAISISGGIAPENALDALLDELQTFAKPQQYTDDGRPDDSTSDDSSHTLQNTITTQHSQSNFFTPEDINNLQIVNNSNNPNMNSLTHSNFSNSNMGSLRRLHSYPSGSDTDTSPPQQTRPAGKPPVPERNADLLSKVSNKRIPPPPPPRTSSRSPLASPTSPNIPQRLPSVNETEQFENGSSHDCSSENSSGNESGNDHVQRQLALEMRHQELLKKQKMLQEQYAKLQQMSKNSISITTNTDIMKLKKTGSDSNLPKKMGLTMSVTGSMKNLNADINIAEKNEKNLNNLHQNEIKQDNGNSSMLTGCNKTTTKQVYETDIL